MTKMPIKANRRASNPPRRKMGSKLLSPTLDCSPQSELAEELLHTIYNSSPVGICVLQDRRFQYVNSKFVELTGYSKDELLAMPSMKLVLPEDRSMVRESAIEMLKGKRFYPYEFRAINKAGEPRWIIATVSSIQYRGSRAVLGNWMDITEHKQMEEELADELTRRRLLIDQSLDGIVVLDVNARVVEANQSFADMLGYTLEEVRELHTWDWDKNFPPEQILEMGQNVDEKGLHLETKHTRKDGSVIDVDISISAAMFGGQKLIFCVCRDITERKQAEEALKASRASFHNIVERSADGIVVTDSNGVIRFVNQALESLLNHKADELLGEMFNFPVVAGEGTEIDIVRRDGEPGVAEMRVVETKWDGETAYLASVRDITERKQVEEKLRELDRMKSELISNISHELRSPLHSTQGFTKLMLQKKVPDPETQEEFLAIIDEQIERLGKLIDDLLDMSRFEAGRFSIQKRRTSVRDVIHDVVGSFDCLAREKGLIINEDIPASLPEIEADEERLKQVMFNLISNAIKFRQDNSPIMVKAENRGSELLVQVIDHGIGISTEAMPHLFERFYRAKDTMARGGTGLGLYISKQIIEEHGGRIWAESEPGKGSTFYFTIPKLKQKRKKIGEILVADGLITRQQLEEKLRKQQDGEYRP